MKYTSNQKVYSTTFSSFPSKHKVHSGVGHIQNDLQSEKKVNSYLIESDRQKIN